MISLSNFSIASLIYFVANAIALLMLPDNCTIGKNIAESIVSPQLAVLLTASVGFGIYDSVASIIGESLICT